MLTTNTVLLVPKFIPLEICKFVTHTLLLKHAQHDVPGDPQRGAGPRGGVGSDTARGSGARAQAAVPAGAGHGSPPGGRHRGDAGVPAHAGGCRGDEWHGHA